MQERHKDGNLYFRELAYSTEKYIIPYIRKYYEISTNTRILEIGCGAGGNLEPFIKMGCHVTGFDQDKKRIKEAREILDAENNSNVNLFAENVFNVKDLGLFDIIFVRDVIEHITDKEYFFEHIKRFLAVDGIIYFAFPAWYMPFGGHQQLCKSKILSTLPYYHILPKTLYKVILRLFKEPKDTIDELIDIKNCRLTVEQFRKLAKKSNYYIINETLYFINPHYEIKFKLKPRLLSPVIRKIPFVRNFFATSCFYILKSKKATS